MPTRPVKHSERHFASHDLGDQSFFTSTFPVPRDAEDINKIVTKKLPDLIDTVFMMKGASRTQETGQIPLQPVGARIEIKKANEETPVLRSRHFTLSALTEGKPLKSFNVQIDQDASTVGSFSLLINSAAQGGIEGCFELRGVIDPNDEDSVYEFTTYTNGTQERNVLVDETIARDIVLALCELHDPVRLPDQSLESGLLTAVGFANEVSLQEFGEYTPENNDRIALMIDRAQHIKDGLARTTFLSVLFIDTLSTPMATTKRSFKFVRDVKKSPVYSANLSYLITSYDDQYGHKERESTFETESTMFRANPSMLYQATENTIADVASEPLS